MDPASPELPDAHGRSPSAAESNTARVDGPGAGTGDGLTSIESAWQEGEDRFRQLANAMPQLVWTADPDGTVDYYNARWEEYRGITPTKGDQAPAWRWAPTLHPDDEPATVAAWERAVRSGTPYEIEHRVSMADGSIRWHLSRGIPRRDPAGKIVKWYGTATDIHDFRVAQEAARRNEERYRLVARATNDVIWDWDLRTGRIEWGEASLERLGCTAAQLGNSLGGWRARVHPDDRARVEAGIHAALEGDKEIWSDEYRFLRKEGGFGFFLDRGHIARDDAGRAYRMIGSILDVTKLRAAEAELRRAKEEAERANKAKDEFLAALSHELRTPLTPVLMVTQMLENEATFAPEVRDDLRMIRRNVELEIRLIDDLLDLTRITRGKLLMNLEPIDTHRALREAAQIGRDDMFSQKALTLRYELAAENFWVMADAARLGQVFWNLIKNAVKFTPEGGTITLRSRNPSPERLELSVSDNGRGIERSFLPHIFDAFEQGGPHITRQFGGLGLGLAICRAVMELHGGLIRAESAGAGCGAEFVLELPVHLPGPQSEADPRTLASAERMAPADETRRRILLVEDHEHSAKAIARLLGRAGYEVRVVGSVKSALAAAEAAPFDLLVSDLGLPDGSGNDLMRQLRERHKLRGIALSGFGMEEDIARSREAGFEAHLVKPVRVQQLLAIIRDLPARAS